MRFTFKITIIKRQVKKLMLLFLVFGTLISCQTNENYSKDGNSKLQLPDKPNILWLVTEDMGPYIPAFGDTTIQTPNLSRLATEGVIYTNLFSPSGVCAPSRAAIATGMYPSSIGANHMRTSSYTEITGLPAYEAVPPTEVRMLSELLRMNGYYCTNNNKTDYQFKEPMTAWDENSRFAHWRNRKKDQPFFSIFNFTQTHESGLFEPYGFKKGEFRHYIAGDTSKLNLNRAGQTKERETTIHLPQSTDFSIPPYLPDTETVRRDLWKMYNNIAEMDQQVGAVLKQLEDDGLLENTIVFFYGDHGGPLPRQKRLIYDSGLHTPMIIRFPDKQKAGKNEDQLTSFIDFVPTLLSLIGIEPPEYLQGQAFLGSYQSEVERKYIHAAADRFDGFTDAIRAVRDDRFKYIRNYRPEQGYYLPVEYRERIPSMKELLTLRDEGKLNSIQKQWFRKSKPPEELYDCKTDPHEINNLAKDPAYKEKLEELRVEMDRWIKDIGDQPNLEERQLISQLWRGKSQMPSTIEPTILISDGKISMSCSTEGASLGYKVSGNDKAIPKEWEVYKEPFLIPKGSTLMLQAHRIGFKPSKIIKKTIDGLK